MKTYVLITRCPPFAFVDAAALVIVAVAVVVVRVVVVTLRVMFAPCDRRASSASQCDVVRVVRVIFVTVGWRRVAQGLALLLQSWGLNWVAVLYGCAGSLSSGFRVVEGGRRGKVKGLRDWIQD
jgi:hypothetical protein